MGRSAARISWVKRANSFKYVVAAGAVDAVDGLPNVSAQQENVECKVARPPSGAQVYVMPLDEKILGFSNRWYRPAMKSAVERKLEPGLSIRVVNSAYFCATKLEAFASRGKGDYMAGHDL